MGGGGGGEQPVFRSEEAEAQHTEELKTIKISIDRNLLLLPFTCVCA